MTTRGVVSENLRAVCRGPLVGCAGAVVQRLLPVLGLLVFGVMPTAAQTVDPDLWGTNGTVTTIARSASRVYIGGSFTQVGPSSGYGVPIRCATGKVVKPYPKVAGGYVSAVAPDGSGGWFIGGGGFLAVGGALRFCLAHILSDGSVSAWDPSPNSWIRTIAVNGNRVYVGGAFTEIAGEPRNRLAAFEISTGELTDWNPSSSSWIDALSLEGDRVYIGGHFLAMGGVYRNYIAAVDTINGGLTPWNPWADGEVMTLAVHGDVVYAGGEFHGIGGQARNHLAALDKNTGLATSWNPGIANRPEEYESGPPLVQALAVRGDTVYVGGAYFMIGGQGRQGLAAVDGNTGAVLDWNPNPAGWWTFVYAAALALRDQDLYVGGYFETIGGQSRHCLAAVDVETGLATGWDPSPNNGVRALAVHGDVVYAGGTFTSLGPWAYRNNVAALDAATGEVTSWNPNAAGYYVNALAVRDTTVYVGGDFGSIGGATRVGLAAIGATSGAATVWDPQANGAVEALALDGSTLYVGGAFSSIGGEARRCLAAVDVASESVQPWVADADDKPTGLAVAKGTVYAWGFFGSVGGQPRNGLAALDAETGAVRDWNPAPDSWVNTVVVGDSAVYVGGAFSNIGGASRVCIAALDAETGLATDWNPGANDEVHALAVSGNTVYAGGRFRTIGGQARTAVAALDGTTGEVIEDWDPGRDGIVWSLLTYGNTLYAGGMFSGMGDLPSSNFAGVSIPELPVEPMYAFALGQSIPNPSVGQARIRYTLPGAATVTLAAYDVQGRRVATWVDHEPQSAGRHEVAVRAVGWRPGMYLYRLEAGGRSATRKMIVVK